MISIITCVFNQRRDFFRACAKSVAAQEAPIEWILIDDGSASESKSVYDEVLRELDNPPLVTRIDLPRNCGLSVARNIGISQSKGEWIVVLDSDDELSPEMTDVLASVRSAVGLVCFAVEYLKSDGAIETRPVSRWSHLFKKYALSIADPFLWFDFYYHGMIGRRETFEKIGGYNDHLRVGEDQDVLLRACEHLSAEQVLFIDRVGYRYRENPAGVCSTHWTEVEANYGSTMVAAARRRGANFDACSLAATRRIDGASVDEYKYRQHGKWLRWRELIGHEPF